MTSLQASTPAGTPDAAEPVVTIEHGDRRITLLGTAHVSRASADKVEELLATQHWDAVAIELCPSRYNAILNPDALARMDLFEIFRDGKATMVLANLALGAYQQRMADQLGIRPGAEMHAAIDGARDRHLPVLLIDREIAVTMKRIYRSVPWWKRFYLVSGLLGSVMSRRSISEEEIERLKEGDMLESTFAEFAQEAREIYDPLIDERDRYMALRIATELSEGGARDLLVVIGAGHLKGIRSYLERYLEAGAAASIPEELAALDSLPPPSRLPKIISWVIVAVILIGFGIGFSQSPEFGLELVWIWILINGGLAAFGSILAGARPLSVVTAFVAAPFTSLNPTIGAGMITGAVEAWLRKPQVGDFTRLRTDTATMRGWWRNRVSRILLVFLGSSIGSAAGTYIAGFLIFQRIMAG